MPSLNLLLGQTGAGKTSYIVESIKQYIHSDKKVIFLVPMQQSYLAETDMLNRLDSSAFASFQVHTFPSLAESIFHTYGGVTNKNLDAGLRRVLMWKTLKELSPLLNKFGESAANDPTLSQRMLDTLDELSMSNIQSKVLEDVGEDIKNKNSNLSQKLKELALIKEAYTFNVKTLLGFSPNERLQDAFMLSKDKGFFHNTVVFIDSFIHFSNEEKLLLEEIIKESDETVVSLCTDALHSEKSHFSAINSTIECLQTIAGRNNISVYKNILEGEHTKRKEPIRFLGNTLWDFSIQNPKGGDIPTKDEEQKRKEIQKVITLISATNVYEEADAAARYILSLKDQGYAFKDIALFVRNIDTYKDVLESSFSHYGIPMFLSDRRDFSSHVLYRFLISSLRAIIYDYRIEEILTLLKTGLTPNKAKDIDRFEEYTKAWNLSGSRMKDEKWNMNPEGHFASFSPRGEKILQSANAVKDQIMKALTNLELRMKNADNIKDYSIALYEYLCEMRVKEGLCSLATSEIQRKEMRDAGETMRLFDTLVDALLELSSLIPDTKVTITDYYNILILLLSGKSLGSVPGEKDSITIGSASDLRVENVRAALLLGLNEGVFPANPGESSLITDKEKKYLAQALGKDGLSFSETSEYQNAKELFYIYRAITRPTEKLYLSYPSKSVGGNDLSPSIAFNRAQELLNIPVINPNIASGTFNHIPDAVQENLVSEKETLRLSQTSIKTFVNCPYSYYVSHDLPLRETSSAKTSNAEKGTFMHYVFEKFFEKIPKKDGKYEYPSDKVCQELSEELVKEYILENIPFADETLSTHTLELISRWKLLTKTLLVHMVEELRNSLFVPYAFEKGIGKNDGLTPYLISVNATKNVQMSGVIDRLDIYEDENTKKHYVRVIDYKSGSHEFKPQDIEKGTDIQLILYLASVINHDKSLIPAGAEFLAVDKKAETYSFVKNGFTLSDANVLHAQDVNDQIQNMKSMKVLSLEEILAYKNTMDETIKKIAENIFSGVITKTPSKDACKFCKIRNNCDKAEKIYNQ